MIRHTVYAGPQKLNCRESESGWKSVESDFAERRTIRRARVRPHARRATSPPARQRSQMLR